MFFPWFGVYPMIEFEKKTRVFGVFSLALIDFLSKCEESTCFLIANLFARNEFNDSCCGGLADMTFRYSCHFGLKSSGGL